MTKRRTPLLPPQMIDALAMTRAAVKDQVSSSGGAMKRKRSANLIACPECWKDIAIRESIPTTLARLERAAMARHDAYRLFIKPEEWSIKAMQALSYLRAQKDTDLHHACAAHEAWLKKEKR